MRDGRLARPTRPAQLEEMKELLDEAMKDGAFGLSTMLAEPARARGHDRRHRRALQGRQAPRRHLLVAHPQRGDRTCSTRSRKRSTIGERAGVPVDIIHLKIADQKLWGRMKEVVALIDEARRERRQRAGQRLSLHPRQQQPGQHHPALGPRRRHRDACSPGSRTRTRATG